MVLDFHECISNHRSTDIDRKQCHLKLVVAIFWLNLFNILKKKISMVRYNKTFKVSNYNMWVFINYKKRVYSFKNNILKRKIYWLLVCWSLRKEKFKLNSFFSQARKSMIHCTAKNDKTYYKNFSIFSMYSSQCTRIKFIRHVLKWFLFIFFTSPPPPPTGSTLTWLVQSLYISACKLSLDIINHKTN